MNICERILESCEEATKVTEAKEVIGIVDKNNALNKDPLDLAMVIVKGIKERVAVTPNTKLLDYKTMKDIKIGDKVKMEVENTSRGPHAKTLSKK